MAFRFFVVPVRDDGSAAAELNGFLGSHRVLAVDRRWVDQGAESYWSFPSIRQLVRQDGHAQRYFAVPDLSSLSRPAYQLANARRNFDPPGETVEMTVTAPADLDRLDNLLDRLLDVSTWDELLDRATAPGCANAD